MRASLGAEIHAALGDYVYGLEDPRSGALFYIGRGVGDRVADLVDDEQLGPAEEPEAFAQRAFTLGLGERADELGQRGEVDAAAGLHGLDGERDGEVGRPLDPARLATTPRGRWIYMHCRCRSALRTWQHLATAMKKGSGGGASALDLIGGATGNRTPDLLNAIQASRPTPRSTAPDGATKNRRKPGGFLTIPARRRTQVSATWLHHGCTPRYPWRPGLFNAAAAGGVSP